MTPSNKLLSEIVAFRTYARYLSHAGRRESLEETINRNMIMHLDRFPKLSKDIVSAYKQVHELNVMPSMRAMQFSGDAILKNNARMFNCSYLAVDDIRAFGEVLFLLLSGVGVGFSIQKRHISRLPKVRGPREEGMFMAQDSIIGWAQCVDALIDAYFLGRVRPVFNFSNIRAKGSLLVTTGAQAPGPEPLKKMLEILEGRLKEATGRRLTSIELHDIICIISEAVLAGGVRRSALISLFDRDDEDMLRAKSGEWWLKHPYRARANNSAVMPRQEVKKDEFLHIFNMCRESGAGEPGISWTNNMDIGANPCHEIALNSHQMCNLSTINQTGIRNERDLIKRARATALIGTLQATYTDFPYLRQSWKETTDREALLGVSFTGIADVHGVITQELLEKAAQTVLETNEKFAKRLGINVSARSTSVKPEGTSSCILGSSSGIHDRHSRFYLRRVRMNKDDSLAIYLQNTIPELVEQDKFSSTGVVVTIPQESPEGASVRENTTAIEMLDRAIFYNVNWVRSGYRSGDNQHNVSVTISVKDDEWEKLGERLWRDRDLYNGVSLLPFDGGSYEQAPFESCDRETFDRLNALVKEIDLKRVTEETDNTVRIETIACSGGACEIV